MQGDELDIVRNAFFITAEKTICLLMSITLKQEKPSYHTSHLFIRKRNDLWGGNEGFF